jgi:serine protease Do
MGVGAAALAAAVLAGIGVNAADEGPGRGVEKKRRLEIMRGPGSGHLGVTLEDGEEPGAVVKDVRPDTPAARAGLQAGDVIVRYQGDRVESAAALARMVRETPAGRQVQMDVRRNGSVQRLSATLEKGHGLHRLAEGLHPEALEDFDIELPDIPPLPDVPAVPPIPPAVRGFERSEGFRRLLRETGGARKLGIEYQEISGQLARYFKLGDERGILVSQVDDDGPAARAGLKAGDVILKFNGNAVTDSRILREQVRRAEPGSEATLTVSREGRTLDLTVKLGGTAPARRPERTT